MKLKSAYYYCKTFTIIRKSTHISNLFYLCKTPTLPRSNCQLVSNYRFSFELFTNVYLLFFWNLPTFLSNVDFFKGVDYVYPRLVAIVICTGRCWVFDQAGGSNLISFIIGVRKTRLDLNISFANSSKCQWTEWKRSIQKLNLP